MNRFSALFWIASSLFTLHQLIEIWYSIPWVHAYLDDLLAPIIVLGLALYFFQFIFPADPSYQHSVFLLVIFVFWYGVLFELVFPYYDARHYADPWDLLAYATGTLLFYKWGNEPFKQKVV